MFAKRGVKKFLGKACRDRSLVAEIRDKIFEDVTGTQTLLFAIVRVVSRHRVAQSQPLGCSTMASLPKQIFYRRALGDGSSINPKRERERRDAGGIDVKKRPRIKREFLFPVFQSLSPRPTSPSSASPLLSTPLCRRRGWKKIERKGRISFHRLSRFTFQLACFISTVDSSLSSRVVDIPR